MKGTILAKTPSLTNVDQYALTELTLRGIILGALITVVFTASNIYLGLKVGLTFSSSIPAAVISMAILQMFRNSNILENNMVQTQASAAGTLSSVIFILPGLLMLGYWQGFNFWQTMLVCAAGGILGVMFSIPLRHVLVVKSDLPYPEGVAAAEILRVGSELSSSSKKDKKGVGAKQENKSKEESGLRHIIWGSAISSLFSLCNGGLRIVSDSASFWFAWGKSIFQLPFGFSLALLGAGYLVGVTAGIAMLVGLVLSWGVFVPYLTAQADMPVGVDIANFAMGIWKNEVRFIGAGTMAVAAVWTLITLFKPMIEGMKLSFRALSKVDQANLQTKRTELDLAPRWIILFTILMVGILFATFYSFVEIAPISNGLAWGLIVCATLLAVVIGFLVAAACGYMAGLVGSSSSPISGIAIIAVVVSSLVILVIAETNNLLLTREGTQFATALAIFTTTAVIAMATISNDNLQDLKTGWLIGATPWRQQVALLIGSVIGACVIAPVLDLLYHAYGFTGAIPRPNMDMSQVLSAPQATLMTVIAQGIFTYQLEWKYIIIGLVLGGILVLIDSSLKAKACRFRLPVLAVGMGLYLPPSLNMPMVIGAFLAYYVEWRIKRKAKARNLPAEELLKKAERRGTLFASGLIVGESLIGVLIALVIVISVSTGGGETPLAIVGDGFASIAQYLGLATFVAVCIGFVRRTLRA